jgi:hypothetical protein
VLGAVLLTVMSGPIALDGPAVLGSAAAALLVPLLVTAASLPTAARIMRPDGLRTE